MNPVQVNHFTQELRRKDLKVTSARLGVLSALETSTTPQDASSINRYLSRHGISVDRVTVFRILNTFTQAGLATPIQLDRGKSRYEYSMKADHHHFICEHCGNIIDVSDCAVKSIQKTLEKEHGVRISRHSLEFFGLCKNCN